MVEAAPVAIVFNGRLVLAVSSLVRSRSTTGGEDICEDDALEDDALVGDGRDSMPSRRTFARAWYGSWSNVLRLKFPSDHSCCQTCFELRERTYRTWAPLHEKLHYARRWRDHLKDQYNKVEPTRRGQRRW